MIPRDTNAAPDYGYHYDPLDIIFGGCHANSTLNFPADCAVAWYDSSGYGIALNTNVVANFNGAASAPCVFTLYSTVQEENYSSWLGYNWVWFGMCGIGSSTAPSAAPLVSSQFTHFYSLAGQHNLFRDYTIEFKLSANGCEFYNLEFAGYGIWSCLTNCLWDRSYLCIQSAGGSEMMLNNCTVHGGILQDAHWGSWPVGITNCAFDGTAFSLDTGYTYCDYNAFVTNQPVLPVPATNNLCVINFNWQYGTLGTYYLPSNSPLVDHGSTNASLLGLYHFTTQTNQLIEGSSTIDIGYHYVATDQYGVPLDYNLDGVPDYLEDANGDGITDNGETSWTNMDLDADGIPNWWEIAHGLNPLSAADAVQDPDYDGRCNLQEYQDGTEPQSPGSVALVQLGNWRFDNTNKWAGDAGQIPLLATNICSAADWDTNAVVIDTNVPAFLKYRDVETNGSANINLRSGTIQFWFMPDWSSSTAGGTGPQKEGRFIEMGAKGAANGWWGLLVSSSGTNLYFGTQTNSGALTTNLSAGISWTNSTWHQIALTYSSTNTSLYIDGQAVLTNGSGIVYYPGLAVRTNGFFVGSDSTGTNQARGEFDNLATYNYPLSASAIQSNYLAAVNGDRNGDGMGDLWELQHFGQLNVNPSADPDGDGFSNLQEFQNGTDPNQFDQGRLGYWQFNDPPSWLDVNGLAPSSINGLFPMPSWSGDAVRIDSIPNGFLSYPTVRSNGSAVFMYPSGALRFWFKPEWNSYDGNQSTGPGVIVRLFEVGQETPDSTNGLFALSINRLGTMLIFSTEANGIHIDNASYPISFNSKSWYDIVLTYTPSNSVLYVNGICQATNGLGWTNVPSTNVLQQGFRLGCSWDGTSQANGLFDELETFNYPLTAYAIQTNYQAIMSIDSDGDGLADVTENGLGTRPDAIDSDCDGLPDAWEVANGLNPNDPSDATPAMIALYASGESVSGANSQMFVPATNLVDIEFVSNVSSNAGVSVYGGVVAANGTNDVWNFCDNSLNYLTGVSMRDANSNLISAKLYAYLGPCLTPFILPPPAPASMLATSSDPNWAQACTTYTNVNVTTYPGYLVTNTITCHPTTASGPECGYVGQQITSTPSYLVPGSNIVTICFDTGIGSSLGGYNILNGSGLTSFLGGYNAYENPIWGYNLSHTYGGISGFTDFGSANYVFFSSWYWPLVSEASVTAGHPVKYTGVTSPYYFYFDDNWGQNGPFYSLSSFDQTELSGVFGSATAYAQLPLESFVSMLGLSSITTGYRPEGSVNCFVPPFESIVHKGATLSGTDGATWQCSGNSETVAGGWFHNFYPQAKRTLLIDGLTNGIYSLYIYFDSPLAVKPAVLNNVASVTRTNSLGTKYWYASVNTKSFKTVTSTTPAVTFAQTLYAPAPFWLVTNLVNRQCIEIDLDSPNVYDKNSDLKVLGFQMVKTSDLSAFGTALQAFPGQSTNYLVWAQSFNATNYNVYKAVSTTNTWTLLTSTTNLAYWDGSVTVGTTYFYKVTPVDPGLSNELSSAIVSSVPFGCPDSLPPSIDYVNPLKSTAINGTYAVTYQFLMTNSDAYDPQGLPLVFKVESVTSGSLMIDGAPYGPGHDTISNNTSVVWIPPAVKASGTTAAFKVYVFDGINRSIKTVNLFIQTHPQPYLMAWGENGMMGEYTDNAGALGTGFMNVPVDWSSGLGFYDFDDQTGNPVFKYQNQFGIYPFDPRWNLNFLTNSGPDKVNLLGDPPRKMLDLDLAKNITDFGWNGLGHGAVTSDNRLWFWGDCCASVIGRPLVITNDPGVATNLVIWNSSTPGLILNQQLMSFILLSPVQVQDPMTSQAMTNVALAKDIFVAKTDGSLWSFGEGGSYLGRVPTSPGDNYGTGDTARGMLLGRVEIPGNDDSGILAGREVVEINTTGSPGDEDPEEGCAALARCKDGSLWSWGEMFDEAGLTDYIYFQLCGDNSANPFVPKELTAVESASSSPIQQIAEGWNHVVILRQDNSISEIGYIPGWDPARMMEPSEIYPGEFDLFLFGAIPIGDFESVYSSSPVVVSNVPPGVRQICSSPTFGSLLTESGQVWVWGQWLGNLYTTPHQIPSLTGIVKIVNGPQFIMAIDQGGRVWGVGYNRQGAFGFNDVTVNPVLSNGALHSNAVQVPGVENASDIFIGRNSGVGWAAQVYAICTGVEDKPTGLTAIASNQAVQLVWNNYPAASSYIVYRSYNQDSGYAVIGTSTSSQYLDQTPPLINGQTYFYEVSAVVNGVETVQSWDAAAIPVSPPSSVQSLVADMACHGIELQWLPPTNMVSSPLQSYLVTADGTQLAQLFPDATNYFDSRQVLTTNYTVTAINSSGQAAATAQVSSTNMIPCPPAPYVATHRYPDNWFIVSKGTSGHDTVTMSWYGATNGLGLFQPYEFNTFTGSTGVPATESVSSFITELQGASPVSDTLAAWLWSQFSNSDTNLLLMPPNIDSVTSVMTLLDQADTNTSPLPAWLWKQFTISETNVLLNSGTSDSGGRVALSQALARILASQNTNTAPAYYSYASQLALEVANSSGAISAGEMSIKINTLVNALNRSLTNGQSASNIALFAASVPQGYFTNNGNGIRPETVTLYTNYPQGDDQIRLKRMFWDDYFKGVYFVHGGNWGSGLSGFKVYYRTLQYVNGHKLAQSLQRTISINDVVRIVNKDYHDDDGMNVGAYQYSWTIPQGALCWGSVAAIADGWEGLVSLENGPRTSQPESGAWNANLRAIPGYHQVYLDWADDPNAFDYDVYYCTNDLSGWSDTSSANWLPVTNSLSLNRFWQTGLSNGIYYYRVDRNLYDGTAQQSYFVQPLVSATVTSTAAPATYQFNADAVPYDGMVLIEWMVPTNSTHPAPLSVNQTNWQFFVEKKNSSDSDTTYFPITDVGYGLAFLDSDVSDGQSYTYRVTAFDSTYNQLQTIAVAKGSSSTQITPSSTNGLTLLQPVPGNAYINLAWSPIRATQFTIERSQSAGGPFSAIATLNVNDAYQSAANTYQDAGLQNGVTYYYQISAITPTGFQLVSGVQSATPSSTFAPLSPEDFKGTILQMNSTNLALLTWSPQAGAAKYQLFLEGDSGFVPILTTSGTSGTYVIPSGVGSSGTIIFALRSVGSSGLTSDFNEITVTNMPPATTTASDPPIVVLVGGQRGSATVAGPTNLIVSADVNVPGAQQVTFYCDAQPIGTSSSSPFQITWYHAPGGLHTVTASVLIGNDGSDYINGGGSSGTLNSDNFYLTVNVKPQLAAYQTSLTDLQLPAPSLPITISRSYTSRSLDTNILGVGWTPSWTMGSVKLSHALEDGWSGVIQQGFASTLSSFINDSTGTVHYLTVTLPNGQAIPFVPQLDFDHTAIGSGDYDEASIEFSTTPTVNFGFQPYDPNAGALSTSLHSLSLNSPTDDSDDPTWDGATIQFDPVSMSQISYTSPDGTFYQFGQPKDSLTWLLTRITDRNGNFQSYVYDSNVNLVAITNSCGRKVKFAYPNSGEIDVFDTIDQSTNPVIKYILASVGGTNQLAQVLKLVDRGGLGTYETNTYQYGKSDISDAPHVAANTNRLTDVYDARGVRVIHTQYRPDDGTVTPAYVSNGDIESQIDVNGRTNLYEIDSDNNLVVQTVTSTVTNTSQINCDASGNISGAMQPVSGTSLPTTNAVQCSYDSQGNLISSTDANGNTKTYTYDSQNRLVGQSDENGNTTSSTLNSYGQPMISMAANGSQTVNQYDNNGNPTSVTDPSGSTTIYTYSSPVLDGSGNILLGAQQTSQSQTAPFVPYTIVTKSAYSTTGPNIGDLISTTDEWVDAGGNIVGTNITTTYTYDANGNRTAEIKTRTVPGGTQTITNAYTYDAQNRVVTTTVGAGGAEILPNQTSVVVYNALGKQATSTDAAGRVTTNIYDFAGNQVETDYPDGTVTRMTYDGSGRQVFNQDRAVSVSGVTVAPATRNTYDASGRVIKVERFASVTLTEETAITNTDYVGPSGQIKMVATDPGTNVLTTTYTFYDAVGRVQYSVSARGAVTQNIYDAAGRLTNTLVYTAYVYNPLLGAPQPTGPCQSTSYTFDADGNQITVTDSAGHTTTSVYDSADRLKEVDYPSGGGTVSQFTYYDGLGRKIQQTDEAGVSTAYTYDFRGLLTSVTLAFGTTQAVTTVYGYDEQGNMVQQTDASGHSTIFKYDALGRKTGRTLPGGQSEGFAYDLAGNQVYQTNFNDVIITNAYDIDGRLIDCSALGYHTAYGYSILGLRTNLVDASGTNSFVYDSLNRLITKTNAWAGGPTVTLHYQYDPLGSLTNLYSGTVNGVSNAYQYDLLGRLTNVLAGGSIAAGYGFDAVGNLQSIHYGNNVTNLYQYDERNRLTNLVWKTGATTLGSFAYTIGVTGNRLASTETVNGASRAYNWAYDYLYRLTGETNSMGAINYNFDAVGNRTNRTSTIAGITNQASTFTANDWLSTDTYDTNGNTTVSGSNGYQYDVMNRLTNVNSGTVLITYDGDGNRVKKTVGGVTTWYLVDDENPSGYAQVLEEYQGSSLSRVYNYGMALISQRQVSSGTVSYFGSDGHGSTRFLADASGVLSDAYAYDAYGLLIASSGLTPNNYLYCGQQFDSDLGFYYLRARYYKPDSGRFWTMDSYEGNNEDPSSLHKYLYCQGNPVMMVDPSGHKATFSAADASAIGKEVHKRMGQQFISGFKPTERVTADSVFTVFGLKNPQSGKTLDGIKRLFPDLVDIQNHEIYEIKPLNAKGIAGGVLQLAVYLEALNKLDPSKRPWGVAIGPEHFNSAYVFFTASPFAAIVVAPPVLGMIFYETEAPEDFVKGRAKNVGQANTSRIQMAWGTSALTSLMLGF